MISLGHLPSVPLCALNLSHKVKQDSHLEVKASQINVSSDKGKVAPVPRVKACFVCNSTEHLASFHHSKKMSSPDKGRNNGAPKSNNESSFRPRVNRCATSVDLAATSVELGTPDTASACREVFASVDRDTAEWRGHGIEAMRRV
jgi:hypothetical protein